MKDQSQNIIAKFEGFADLDIKLGESPRSERVGPVPSELLYSFLHTSFEREGCKVNQPIQSPVHPVNLIVCQNCPEIEHRQAD